METIDLKAEYSTKESEELIRNTVKTLQNEAISNCIKVEINKSTKSSQMKVSSLIKKLKILGTHSICCPQMPRSSWPEELGMIITYLNVLK